MRKIKPVPVDQLDAFIDISLRAFPAMGINSKESRQKYKDRLMSIYEDPDRMIYGNFEEEHLLGGMILYDFTINVHQHFIPAAGVGLVVVDLLRKKEHVAKDLLTFFLRHNMANGVPLALLYPFRPDFYKKMGFGYGTKKNSYRLSPTAFPNSGSKSHIQFLSLDDLEQVVACYDRYARKVHGMIGAIPRVIESYFKKPGSHVVGYVRDGVIHGYLYFKFDKVDDYPLQEIVINEYIYDSSEVLMELLTFLNSQRDQVSRIVFNSHDDTLHFLLDDPRSDSNRIIPPVYHETNTQAVGLMYRLVSTRNFFQLMSQHNFGDESCKVKIKTVDTFLPENNGELIVHFENGRVNLDQEHHDVEIELDVSDLSSLVMGVVSFRKLLDLRRVSLSNADYAGTLNQIFYCSEQPVCLTFF